jgi:histidinol-phosphatase (PHP family)
MIDLHIHSAISHDASSSIRDYCLKAREIGFKEIGFSEHLDLVKADPHFMRHDYEQYLAEVKAAREEFPGLAVRMGVEITFLPSIQKDIADWLEPREYDFALAAVHLTEDGACTVSEEEPCREYFSRKPAEECYREFFDLTLASVRSGLFDALAHLDIINRYGLAHFPDWEWRPHYGAVRRIFEGMIKRNMALEINTSGLRQSPCRTYPEAGLVKLFRELGGRAVTIGSDAHSAEQLGSGVAQAIAMAKELGFNRVVSFERRNLKWIDLKSQG